MKKNIEQVTWDYILGENNENPLEFIHRNLPKVKMPIGARERCNECGGDENTCYGDCNLQDDE